MKENRNLVTNLVTKRRQITWQYVQHARNWGEETLRLAQAEAEFNGYSPAMYLPLDEYILVQHPNITMKELNVV